MDHPNDTSTDEFTLAERLTRNGHMGELLGEDPAEVDRFVRQLRAAWLTEIDLAEGAP
jgi:hypothetical protein